MTVKVSRTDVTEFLRSAVAEQLHIRPEGVAADRPLADLGLDQLRLLAVVRALVRRLDRAVPGWAVEQYPTISMLAGYLAANPADEPDGLAEPRMVDRLSTAEYEPIAIIDLATSHSRRPADLAGSRIGAFFRGAGDSSLAAVDRAVRSLRAGESDLALAGEDGGVLVLRRLSDAQAAGDRVYALIRGSAATSGDVFRAAWHNAGVPPSEVSFVDESGSVRRTALALYRGELPGSPRFAGVGDGHAHVAMAAAEPRSRWAAPETGTPHPLVFVFPGHGSQWLGMGRDLLAEPAFRATLSTCDQALMEVTGRSVLDELLADAGRSRLYRTAVAQPALFAVQVAQAELLRSRGVHPDAVVGQGIGEVPAAVVAGALSLRDGARISGTWSTVVAERARGSGAVIVAEMSIPDAERLAAGSGDVDVAGHLGDGQVSFAGGVDAVVDLEHELDRAGIPVHWVDTDHPAHGGRLRDLAPELERRLGEIRPAAASLPLYSTVTGGRVSGTELDAAYWADNMCQPVLFAEVVDALTARNPCQFVEVVPRYTGRGPRAVLNS